MKPEIKNKLTQLNHLLETAQKQKILWEEMQIVSDKAFTIQDELMVLLDDAEQNETDIQKLQLLFSTREIVWDSIAQIAKQEMLIKEKTHQKKDCSSPKKENGCQCHSHSHRESDCCSQTTQKECCTEHVCCTDYLYTGIEDKSDETACSKGACSCQKKK